MMRMNKHDDGKGGKLSFHEALNDPQEQAKLTQVLGENYSQRSEVYQRAVAGDWKSMEQSYKHYYDRPRDVVKALANDGKMGGYEMFGWFSEAEFQTDFVNHTWKEAGDTGIK